MRNPCKHTSGKTRMVDVSTLTGGPPDLHETEDWRDWAVEGVCEYGNCVEFNCPVCGCNRYGGFGPMDCSCQDWIHYRDMRAKTKVANKPSLRTNGVRRRMHRKVK